MKTVKGNLLDMFDNGDFDVIAHGCNCHHVMGGGIAAQIAQRYPGVYYVDRQYTKSGDINKLGTFTCAYPDTNDQRVYNLYTQFNFGAKGVYVDYDALTLCLRKLNALEKGKKVGLPLIGGGLAGGDEGVITSIMEREMRGCDTTLVLFDGPPMPKRDYKSDPKSQDADEDFGDSLLTHLLSNKD